MNKVDTVLVIGKNYSTSLGIVRALGCMGIKVDVIRCGQDRLCPELCSKYICNWYKSKSSSDNDVMEALQIYKSKYKKDDYKILVIPSDDASARFLDQNYNTFKNDFIVPQAGTQAGDLARYMDKNCQKKLAEASGLSVAKGWSVFISEDGTYNIPNDISYPCYTKPQISVGFPKSYIKKCDTKEQLETLLTEVAQNYTRAEILVEEYIEIDKEYVIPGVSLGQSSCIPAFIEKCSIGKGQHKGVTESGSVISSKQFASTKEKLSMLMKKVALFGLFDIEMIESQGILYFNELNLRNGAATYGVTMAGVNLPYLLVSFYNNGFDDFEKIDIKNTITFVSEKVAFDDYRAGYSTWNDYKNKIKKRSRFLLDWHDIKPYLCYCAIMWKCRLVKKIHR